MEKSCCAKRKAHFTFLSFMVGCSFLFLFATSCETKDGSTQPLKNSMENVQSKVVLFLGMSREEVEKDLPSVDIRDEFQDNLDGTTTVFYGMEEKDWICITYKENCVTQLLVGERVNQKNQSVSDWQTGGVSLGATAEQVIAAYGSNEGTNRVDTVERDGKTIEVVGISYFYDENGTRIEPEDDERSVAFHVTFLLEDNVTAYISISHW